MFAATAGGKPAPIAGEFDGHIEVILEFALGSDFAGRDVANLDSTRKGAPKARPTRMATPGQHQRLAIRSQPRAKATRKSDDRSGRPRGQVSLAFKVDIVGKALAASGDIKSPNACQVGYEKLLTVRGEAHGPRQTGRAACCTCFDFDAQLFLSGRRYRCERG